MTSDKDILAVNRKLLNRRSKYLASRIKSLTVRVSSFGNKDDETELNRLRGQVEGIYYSLKILDRLCQIEMDLKI